MGLTERIREEIKKSVGPIVKPLVDKFLEERLAELGYVPAHRDFRQDVCSVDSHKRCQFEGNRGDIGIIACKSGRPFAEKIIEGLKHQYSKSGRAYSSNFRLIETEERRFANSERKPIIKESIRGMDIFVVQDVENKETGLSVDENYNVLKFTLDAAHRADAHYITAVIPVFPYARQDRAIGREPFAAAMVAREIEDANANRIITLDIHNEAIGGFFRRAVLENLHASKNLVEFIREEGISRNLIMGSPDTGAAPRNAHYAERLETDLALIWKRRNYQEGGRIEEMRLLGEVSGKNVLLVDDMIDTAGTLVKGCRRVKEEGARKVYFATSLPLLNGKALDRLDRAYEQGIVDMIIGTDAVYHGGEEFMKAHEWYREVSVAGYFAKVIFNINHKHSISELLK